MTAADALVRLILNEEGGVADVAGDHGGLTSTGGQTRGWLEGLYGRAVTDDEIRNLTPAKAGENIVLWLSRTGLDALLVAQLDEFAAQVIDFAYQSGEGAAIPALQKALHVAPTAPHVGPATLAALASAQLSRSGLADVIAAARLRFEGRIFARDYQKSMDDVDALLKQIATPQIAAEVKKLMQARQEKFASGWLDRIATIMETYE